MNWLFRLFKRKKRTEKYPVRLGEPKIERYVEPSGRNVGNYESNIRKQEDSHNDINPFIPTYDFGFDSSPSYDFGSSDSSSSDSSSDFGGMGGGDFGGGGSSSDY